jgi:transglutaminase-like putative cysteine protease
MLIAIRHRTDYHYERAFNHAVQSLRLTPPSGTTQHVIEWRIEMPGIETASNYHDSWGNLVHLVTPHGDVSDLSILVHGVIDTHDTGGVVGMTNEAALPPIFLRETPTTKPSKAIAEFARSSARKTRLETLHTLLTGIQRHVAYDTDATHVLTTASEAFESQRGVCQDHAHIYIAAARVLGIPARYVTGYLLVESDEPAVAHHAWAEAYTEDLGWIGFDAANGVCPTPNYVRLAVGLDAPAAAPVRGIMRGSGAEKLSVEVVVRSAQQ